MALSLIERLPTEVLLRICQYVGATRSFGAASKHCWAVANIVTYSKISLTYLTMDTLDEVVDRWRCALQNASSLRHVRCLEITRVESLGKNETLIQAGDDLKFHLKGEYDDQHITKDDVRDKSWRPVAELIHALPALDEVHYSGSQQLAPCVLNAIKAREGCRLFLDKFSLRSLTCPQSNSIRIEPAEVELSTSGCLHGITLPNMRLYDTYGNFDFIEEIVLRLTAGVAPNLKKVSLYLPTHQSSLQLPTQSTFSAQSLADCKGMNIDQLFLNEPRPTISMGALLSLELAGYGRCALPNLRKWGSATEFSKLTSLKLHSDVGKAELIWLTNEARLTSLQSLVLDVTDLHPGSQDFDEQLGDLGTLLIMFFSKLNPLLDLKITGICDLETIDEIVNMQETKLQKLAVFVCANKRFDKLYAPVAYRSWKLPVLEELAIPVHRTGGNLEEVQVYQWVGSNFPNLRKLFLRLDCGHTIEESSEGNSPLGVDARMHDDFDETHRQSNLRGLQYVIKNSTIDGELAKAIFQKVSSAKAPGGRILQRLELHVEEDFSAIPGMDSISYYCTSVLGSPWVCERSTRDDRPHELLTKRIHTPDYDECIQSDEYNQEWIEIFHSIWPKRADKEWYEVYHSLPLVETSTDITHNQTSNE